MEALLAVPRLDQGIQLVYVLDDSSEQVRLFEVNREAVNSCDGASTEPLGGCAEIWNTSAMQLTAPSGDVARIQEAVRSYKRFAADARTQDASELPLDRFPIDSAADLIGPAAGPPSDHDPAYLRGVFENAISNAMNDTWREVRSRETLDLGSQVWARLVGERRGLETIVVNFSDGTRIEVDVENVKWENGNVVSFSLKVDISSAVGPGLPQIPGTPSGFMQGPAANGGLVGNLAYIKNLADLFVRGGGRVDYKETSGSCQSTFVCYYVQDSDTGVWERRCEVRAPKPELNC